MSAPLVVNTTDGTCWVRRTVTRGGLALYAPMGVCNCPEFVMATMAELAEHGIAGSADVLPMPTSPVPVALKSLVLTEQQIEALAAAGDRVVNDAVHEDLCACDAWPDKCLSTGNFFMGAWDVSGLETALPAVLALWEQMRGGELVQLWARVAGLEAETYVAPSPSCTRCYGADAARFVAKGGATSPCHVCGPSEVELLRARVAELEAERHSTNEALSDAMAERTADRWTAFFAPTQALRENPHDSPLHRTYLVGRDLPETGGAS